MYIERERRALTLRCNMLARRFTRSTKQFEVTLFKAYCRSFCTCSLGEGTRTMRLMLYEHNKMTYLEY